MGVSPWKFIWGISKDNILSEKKIIDNNFKINIFTYNSFVDFKRGKMINYSI